MTREAQDRGGLLTQENLARLLCASRSTIKRDGAQLRAEGIDVPTRGQVKDIGKGVSHKGREAGEIVPTRGKVHDIGPSVTHKGEVIRRWLRHESPAQIARVLKHAQESLDRYIADLQKVRTLAQQRQTGMAQSH